MQPITPSQALSRLQDYCARAEHCNYECAQKLRLWGISQADSQSILDQLKADRYIDDQRFASAFARDKVKFSHWGARKIRQALMLKRLPSDIIAQALDSIDPDVYQQVRQHLIDAKLRTDPTLLDTPAGRLKLRQFLFSRGF